MSSASVLLLLFIGLAVAMAVAAYMYKPPTTQQQQQQQQQQQSSGNDDDANDSSPDETAARNTVNHKMPGLNWFHSASAVSRGDVTHGGKEEKTLEWCRDHPTKSTCLQLLGNN